MKLTDSRHMLLLIIILFESTGCHRNETLPGESGTVTGQAIYQGSPVPPHSAIVMVHDDFGFVGAGLTNSMGEFQIRMRGDTKVLVGKYKVNVTPPGEPDHEQGELNSETVPEVWNRIPQKYWTQTSTPERYTVQPGRNYYRFELNDN